ncbi:hypothetical protein ACIPWL_03745 [Streptomyces sp. NPDC090023]
MENYGGPEVLKVRDIPEPGVEPEHRRIEVTRSGVNFADLLVREDDYLTGVPLPFVPGPTPSPTISRQRPTAGRRPHWR